ncbi:MAG: NADP-dependent malic enzyme, partial [Thermococcus sp.]
MDARDFHRGNFIGNGKIEVIPKVPLTRESLPLAYTPGVAEVSREIAEEPERAFEYTNRGNTIAVVSDGTRVLGLGDIGPLGALPVMEGKALLFKAFGGVDAFPLVLAEKGPERFIDVV